MQIGESGSESVGLEGGKGLLEVPEVADYLGVGQVTVQRWCREGSLSAIKVGRAWRVRREALEEFLYGKERSSGSTGSGSTKPDSKKPGCTESVATLTAMLRSFLHVPDNVLAISQTTELMHRLDAAFFQAAEANGAVMVKYHAGASPGGIPDGSPEKNVDHLREKLVGYGLEVKRLESEGRLRLLSETEALDKEAPARRSQELQRLLGQEAKHGRSVWAAFDWEERIDLEAALDQQREITGLVEDSRLVVKTAMLEELADDWPAGTWRRVKAAQTGSLWLSEAGLSTSRVLAVPAD